MAASDKDFTGSGPVQESGLPLSKDEISRKTVPESRRPKTVPDGYVDKGTLEVEELNEEVSVASESPEPNSSEEEEITSPNDDDRTFMGKADEMAERSPDTDTKVGAVLVSARVSASQPREILGEGWNRMPKGCEDRFTWENEGEILKQKYPYVLHGGACAFVDAAKKNNAKRLEGATLYITLFPDNKDAQLILEYGVKEVVYREDKYHRKIFAKASRKLLEGVVKCRQIVE